MEIQLEIIIPSHFKLPIAYFTEPTKQKNKQSHLKKLHKRNAAKSCENHMVTNETEATP